MPTVIAHPAAAIGLFPWFRRHLGAPVVLFAGAFLTVAPDLDVIAFRFGIPYEHMFGHRGISHSLAAAFFTSGMLAAAIARWRRRHFGLLWAYFFLCMASHGPLDMLTSGGRGIAVFAPFSNERYFFDVRPIAVSAIGVGDFLSGRWTLVLTSEMRWVWLPSLGVAILGTAVTLLHGRRQQPPQPLAVEQEEGSPGSP